MTSTTGPAATTLPLGEQDTRRWDPAAMGRAERHLATALELTADEGVRAHLTARFGLQGPSTLT